MTTSLSIADTLEKHLASDKTQLPVFDPVAHKVRSMLADRQFDMGKLEQLISRDAALASAILRYANSAFFGGMEKVTTVGEAVMRLGAEQVSKLVLLACQATNFRTRSKSLRALMQSLWKHSVGCAFGSEWLARRCGFPERASEAFLAGLLHDVGKLLVLRVVDDLVHSTRNFRPNRDLLLQMLDGLHAEQGHRLLQKWNFPEVYSEIVRCHHDNEFEASDVLMLTVRLADVACHKLGIGLVHDPSIVLATAMEAHCLAASQVLLAEFEIMLEDVMALAR